MSLMSKTHDFTGAQSMYVFSLFPRWHGKVRPYAAEDVARLRGQRAVRHKYPADAQAKKLFAMFKVRGGVRFPVLTCFKEEPKRQKGSFVPKRSFSSSKI